MKKFKILGIIAIVVIIISIIDFIQAEWKNVEKGWQEGSRQAEQMDRKDPQSIPYTTTLIGVNVKAVSEVVTDSLTNTDYGRHMPYEISEITTYVKPPIWHHLIMFLILPVAGSFLFGFYCLIRMLISMSRRHVLTRTNVWRMRCFAYSYMAINLCEFLMEQLQSSTLKQIDLPGYEIIGLADHSVHWMGTILFLLFAEIFAVAVKLQEEQELTI